MIKLFRSLSLIISVAFFAGCNEEEIKPIEPTSITIEPPSVTMTAGETLQLSATVEPQNVTDKEVTWTSSNPSVASVSPSGMVSAVKKGETVVTALIGKCISVCNVHVVDKTIDVSAIELDITEYSVTEGESFSITATVSPADASDKTLEWSSNNVAVALVDQNGKVTAISEGKATIEVKAGGKVASCIVTVTPLPVQGSEENGHSYVDMGLPSGLKWATCNVGANAPEEFGDYFAWGETEPYYISQTPLIWKDGKEAGYSWASYSENLLWYRSEAYMNPDYDAASVNWGDDWRMPTEDDWDELILYCKSEKAIQNDVIGLKLTSLKNGNSIFLPAAGYRKSEGLYATGHFGGYWTSSSWADDEATDICFNDGIIFGSTLGYGRCCGRSIRPVSGKISVSGVTIETSSLYLNVDDMHTLTATVLPYIATDKSVIWTSTNPSVAAVGNDGLVTAISRGKAVITATTSDGGFMATCTVTVGCPAPEAINLGLSVKWASFNLGASAPEEYGNYCAWGETKPKDVYSETTYKWCNGSYNTLTKYNTESSYGLVDGKTLLELADDAARVNLGGKWRIPTREEWEELLEKCTWKWTSRGGVNGYKVTGPNGNSIFLPAAGLRDYGYLYAEGSYGGYWSSSLYTDRPYYAWYVSFDSDNVDGYRYERFNGQSVRPVTE